MRWWIPVCVGLAACMGGASLDAPSMVMEREQAAEEAPMDVGELDGLMAEADAPGAPPPSVVGGVAGDMDEGGEFKGGASGRKMRAKKESRQRNRGDDKALEDEEQLAKDGEGEDAKPEARTRAWFPESFLWQPLVTTDDDGIATVDMTVPDQLTTWRVLGLAHDRNGHQAGAVHTFDSRLPLYVDPVIPGWLYAGDRLELPVQVVNTTDASVSATLRAESSGALEGAGQVSLPIAAAGSDVVTVSLRAAAAGSGKISARLDSAAGADRADREIPVLPEGRPVRATRGGTLAGDRAFRIAAPAGADATTQELTVQVFPGPLAVLQAEVERLQSGARPANGAYGFALANQLTSLGSGAGVEVDSTDIRKLQLVAWQRIVRASRSPDAGVAADLLAAMRGTDGHELAVALEPRLVRAVVAGQRGDGTWSRTSSSTLQQVLVQTAYAARALPESEEGARLRASGALERYAPQIEDPYTAAVILASGVATDGLEDRLRTLLVESVGEGSDGERHVSVPADVLNAWGYRPSHQEMLAWTTLALADQEQLTWRLDLAAQLMGRYDASWGFGAGPADVVALEAIASGLPTIAQNVQVVLTLDGQEVSRGALDTSQPKIPAVMIAPTRGKVGEIGLRAEPAVPGLAFVATLESWVPWTGEESLPGVEVEAEVSSLAVGRTGTLRLALSAPSGETLEVEQGLPAGTVLDEDSLTAIAGRLSSWDIGTDRVRLTTKPFQAGEVIELRIPVQPGFAGTFSTPPLRVETRRGDEVFFPPQTWEVGGPGAI